MRCIQLKGQWSFFFEWKPIIYMKNIWTQHGHCLNERSFFMGWLQANALLWTTRRAWLPPDGNKPKKGSSTRLRLNATSTHRYYKDTAKFLNAEMKLRLLARLLRYVCQRISLQRRSAANTSYCLNPINGSYENKASNANRLTFKKRDT
ncbi:hypothetical protein M514_01865 [Trichuris suis]|uniref:Uncharacterized protein n=1 Tax=Trichuris suis TaxID=68888 RepID=A0A085MJF8_9BILA|nr:hypothetical protein M513_01865 [Trichuris suis]KFD72741.1 hypothetical protein M514_01865 [Trichuris suis]